MTSPPSGVGPRLRWVHVAGLVLTLAVSGCGRRAVNGVGVGGPDAGGGRDGAGSPCDDAREPEVGAGPIPGLDPGRVVIHRLNSTEYDNTIRDLLGVDGHARATFQPDERGYYFDNTADAFTINDARYEQYFNNAQSIAEAAFTTDANRARVFSCLPAAPGDTTCATTSIATFGLRAWRRPLTDEEVGRFVRLVDAQLAAGKDFAGAMQTVVTAMLSSVSFLYRVELDPEPTSLVPHAVAPYELASRLSYWLWSTMPDETLFRLAATGELAQPPVLLAQLDRLLDDPRSAAFVESFAGQWMGVRELHAHQVEPTAFPDFDPVLRGAMEQEMRLYFEEFLRAGRPFDQFLSADINFVTAPLARHYGMDATGLGATPTRVEVPNDQRVGFLGLGGFLTMTSYSYRSDPLGRARWINNHLFCDPQDPGGLHTLDFPPAVEMGSFHDRAAAIQALPACAGCHRAFDPLGAGFEQFDLVGRFRPQDGQGNPIDASGVLADGRAFKDGRELAGLLATDPRFLPCATEHALTYALGRTVGEGGDATHLSSLGVAWKKKGLNLRALLEQIVLNDTFRFRRGEVTP